MDMTALLLSRIQFAFTITFHIIFPSFTIGLAAWLTFWKPCALRPPLGLSRALRILVEDIRRGIRTGLSCPDRDGISSSARIGARFQECPDDPGPLLMYETFGHSCSRPVSSESYLRPPPRAAWFYLFSTAMVA